MSAGINFGTKVIFQNGSAITLPVAVSDPGSASQGDLYYNSISNLVRFYNGTTWQNMGSGGGSSITINTFTLTPTDITNKFVTLTDSPLTPTDTILNVVGGVIQAYTSDFMISGTILSWSGLGLDGILSNGDKLIIQFQ